MIQTFRDETLGNTMNNSKRKDQGEAQRFSSSTTDSISRGNYVEGVCVCNKLWAF